ncbi:hypothetical protein NDU88_001477 [Pleurodeles waltl]|uniref:Uncharacterized protein n=1 Tax=Pleurodeles waltl TaxID=8319 RepID=A0AAV7THY6_PLEWA|nr:hypothetical protein NDU88_001477 [Pleurodeles waltl]
MPSGAGPEAGCTVGERGETRSGDQGEGSLRGAGLPEITHTHRAQLRRVGGPGVDSGRNGARARTLGKLEQEGGRKGNPGRILVATSTIPMFRAGQVELTEKGYKKAHTVGCQVTLGEITATLKEDTVPSKKMI